jgi:phage shock protein A
MGRFFRAIRGFFGSLLTGVEQRNPEILLETAVQDELNNLKKLQVAAARTMAYEKMLANDAASKQKVVTVKERQARELAARGQREAAIEVVQQKQEAQTSLAEIEARIEEARKNSANEARSNISLSDSSRDLEQARQAIRQTSYEAEAIGELGTSETERQIAAAEIDIKRLDAERELETIELQMGLRDSIEAGEPSEDVSAEQPAEEVQVEQPGEGEQESRG